MRAGGFTVQQTLTTEAANVVKQAVTLARRRGHAQVTPLHVATAMLSPPAGLLRTACLQSQSHPLLCKALELCFNVALNRLPTSSSPSALLGPQQSQHPSISNALVAAFKRAQAQQRRGGGGCSLENQQQPLLAVKIELEQLIISILDDPSVSRVMREAGFSSTQVKINVEKAVSLELCCQTPRPTPTTTDKSNERDIPVLTQSLPAGQFGVKPCRSGPAASDRVRNEDVMSLIEKMTIEKRKSIAIVGESVAAIEGVVGGLMDKVERGEVPEGFREVKFISLPLYSLSQLSREEVENKVVELMCLVKSWVEKGVVLYLGDLIGWTAAAESGGRSGGGDQGMNWKDYCPVEHMIMELGRLICGIEDQIRGRFWLLGFATFQTYRRCRNGHLSLETVWGLHPLTLPVPGVGSNLGLSLIPAASDVESGCRSKNAGNGSSWLLLEGGGGGEKQLNSSAECSTIFGTEVRSSRSSTCTGDTAAASSLPSWLQQYKDQNERLTNHDQDCVPVRDLCEKWNSFCSSAHIHPHSSEITITFSSASPSCSTSGFSYDHKYLNSHLNRHGWPAFEPKQNWNDQIGDRDFEPRLRLYIPEHSDPKQAFPPHDSPSSGDAMDADQYAQRFKKMSSVNLKTMCNALVKKVPWHKDVIPEIATAILECRSGTVRRKGKARSSEAKEETWLFFQGVDMDAKEKIARELARLVFGSHSNLVSIALSRFSSTRADSTEDVAIRNKRSRDEQSCSYVERFADAVSANPHRVFMVEDVEQADYCSQMGIKRAIERGTIMDSNGNEVRLCDAIVILNCESFSSRSRARSPPHMAAAGLEETTSPCAVSLDLNVSFEGDDESEENPSIDDAGLLESVDRRIVFKT